MNESIDLTKILKDCPKGTKFWSPLYDEVEFYRICKFEDGILIHLKTDVMKVIEPDATIVLNNIKSSIMVLYPSKDQRDWSKFTAPWYKKERFDPKTLQPFDRVLVRANLGATWFCTTFSHIRIKTPAYPYQTSSGMYPYCIPYNDDTKNLVGTTDGAP